MNGPWNEWSPEDCFWNTKWVIWGKNSCRDVYYTYKGDFVIGLMCVFFGTRLKI